MKAHFLQLKPILSWVSVVDVMRNTLFFCNILFILSLLVGCSTATERCSDVNQDRIHQSYRASYDGQSDSTRVAASFRFGDASGTTLEMTGSCNITHDTLSLNKTTFLGTSYDGSVSGLRTSHTFNFRDNNNRTFQNSGTISAISISAAPTSVSKAGNLIVSFSPAVGSNETVYLYLNDPAGSGAVASLSTQGSTSITMESNQMTRLAIGAGTLSVKRYQSTQISQASSPGGRFSVEYETAKSAITITN